MEKKLEDALLARLEEAESYLGSNLTTMAMDKVDRSHRLGWLRKTRMLLLDAGRPIQNMRGLWFTEIKEAVLREPNYCDETGCVCKEPDCAYMNK